MSIIITIVSNIIVLVSQNIIFFGFFMPRALVRPLQVPLPHLHLPYQVFTKFVCCFTRNA